MIRAFVMSIHLKCILSWLRGYFRAPKILAFDALQIISKFIFIEGV